MSLRCHSCTESHHAHEYNVLSISFVKVINQGNGRGTGWVTRKCWSSHGWRLNWFAARMVDNRHAQHESGCSRDASNWWGRGLYICISRVVSHVHAVDRTPPRCRSPKSGSERAASSMEGEKRKAMLLCICLVQWAQIKRMYLSMPACMHYRWKMKYIMHLWTVCRGTWAWHCGQLMLWWKARQHACHAFQLTCLTCVTSRWFPCMHDLAVLVRVLCMHVHVPTCPSTIVTPLSNSSIIAEPPRFAAHDGKQHACVQTYIYINFIYIYIYCMSLRWW